MKVSSSVRNHFQCGDLGAFDSTLPNAFRRHMVSVMFPNFFEDLSTKFGFSAEWIVFLGFQL